MIPKESFNPTPNNLDTDEGIMKPTAAELLNGSHPLSESFRSWCQKKGTEPSKRQARKWLQFMDSKRFPWQVVEHLPAIAALQAQSDVELAA